jgi:hypothetical protein
MFNTSAIMSKVDIKARVEGIKLFFNEGGVRKTDKQYFVKSEYPVCEMFDSDVPLMKETVFYVPDEGEDILKPPTQSLDLASLIDSKCVLIVNATVQHCMYGTMRMRDIETISMITPAAES